MEPRALNGACSSQIQKESKAQAKTVFIPISNAFDIEDLENEPHQKLPATTLFSLSEKISGGHSGNVFLLKKDPSTVVKTFFDPCEFILETRIYLYAQNLSDESLPMPQFRGIYHLHKTLFGSAGRKDRVHKYGLGVSKIEGPTLREYAKNGICDKNVRKLQKKNSKNFTISEFFTVM